MQPFAIVLDSFPRFHFSSLPNIVVFLGKCPQNTLVLNGFHSFFCKVRKGEVPVHAMKTYRGSRGVAPPTLNLGSRWKWVASFKFRPLYSRATTAVPIEQDAGWAPSGGLDDIMQCKKTSFRYKNIFFECLLNIVVFFFACFNSIINGQIFLPVLCSRLRFFPS